MGEGRREFGRRMARGWQEDEDCWVEEQDRSVTGVSDGIACNIEE